MRSEEKRQKPKKTMTGADRVEKRIERRERIASAGLVISTLSILGFLYYVLQDAYQNPGWVGFSTSYGVF